MIVRGSDIMYRRKKLTKIIHTPNITKNNKNEIEKNKNIPNSKLTKPQNS